MLVEIALSGFVAAGQASQPPPRADCRPVVTARPAPTRGATANFHDQGRDSITAMYPRHRLLAERRAAEFGKLEYSLLAYQPEPSTAVSIAAFAVDWQAGRTWHIYASCDIPSWPGGLIETLKAVAALHLEATRTGEVELIEAIKATVVREIDPELPPVSFEAWIKGLVGAQARLQWETNDCGEQTGNPAFDRGRIFPKCVEMRVELSGKRALVLLLSAGPQQKQPAGTAGYHYGVVIQPDGSHVEVRRLTGVAAAVR